MSVLVASAGKIYCDRFWKVLISSFSFLLVLVFGSSLIGYIVNRNYYYNNDSRQHILLQLFSCYCKKNNVNENDRTDKGFPF